MKSHISYYSAWDRQTQSDRARQGIIYQVIKEEKNNNITKHLALPEHSQPHQTSYSVPEQPKTHVYVFTQTVSFCVASNSDPINIFNFILFF